MNRAAFFDQIRATLFGGRLTTAQVQGIEGIIDAFGQVGDGSVDTLAYALATAYHETGRRMVPVREGFAETDAAARRAVWRLAEQRGPDSPPARYGASVGPYGHAYYGRGHVQLTWMGNYERSSADAGVDLVAYPDKMLDPVISARVLILGLIDGRWNGDGKGVGHYLPHDPVQARRTVNVLDKATQIAGYYAAFKAALQAAGFVANPLPPTALDDSGTPSGDHQPRRTILDALRDLAALFQRRP